MQTTFEEPNRVGTACRINLVHRLNVMIVAFMLDEMVLSGETIGSPPLLAVLAGILHGILGVLDLVSLQNIEP